MNSNLNFKIYKETEKAIQTAWIFRDPEAKEFLHLTWIPKKRINKDGSIHKGFLNDKLWEIQCKYYYYIKFIGIEDKDSTVEREIRTGAKERVTYKIYGETEKAVKLCFYIALLKHMEATEMIWVPKSQIDEYGIKDWYSTKITADLERKYNYSIDYIEIEKVAVPAETPVEAESKKFNIV